MKKSNVLAAIGLSTVLVSCGSSSGGNGNSNNAGETITSQFIDSPVKGLRFTRSTGGSGSTGDMGKFSCARGEVVNFSLGGLDLGFSACGDQIFVQDLSSTTVAGHNWEKVAQILQTVAEDKNTYLDLSRITQSSLNLSALNLNDVDNDLPTKLTASAAAFPGGVAPALVSRVDAVTHATDSLATNITLANDFLTALANSESDGAFALQGKKVSGDTDFCWENVLVSATVSEFNMPAKAPAQVYQFQVLRFVGYDGTDFSFNTGECSGDDCADSNVMTDIQDRFPTPKIISGTQTTLANSYTYTDAELGGDVSGRYSMNLNAKVVAGGLTVSGTFQEYGEVKTGPNKGKTASCRYNISLLDL